MCINIKKILLLGMTTYLMSCIGCSSNVTSENIETLCCNETSNGSMAEVENGYFLALNDILHYADKSNLELWIPVCNKPDCAHKDKNCNGYLPSNNTFWQKGEQFYEIEAESNVTNGTLSYNMYIYEIITDGSGRKKVYDIPLEDFVSGGKEIGPGICGTFQDEFIVRFWYLDERGERQYNLIRLKEDENGEVLLTPLYQGTQQASANSGNAYWGIRGDNIIVDTRFIEKGDMLFDSLCVIENDEVIPLHLSDDVNKEGAYLEGDIFTYYNQNEGFYQYDRSTGKKTLLFKNQLEDAKGYILSEDCIVECNRYLDSMPKEAYLKVYNGESWSDLEIPKEVANCDTPFYPFCIASDRIFFRMTVTGDDNLSTVYLYYMMLEEENPELVFAGKIGNGTLEESTTKEETVTEEENDVYANFKEVTIFDTDEYLLKITDVYLNHSNRCCIKIYFENRSDKNSYSVYGNHWTINGIQCNTDWGTSAVSANTNGTYIICLDEGRDRIITESKVSDFFTSSEFTDIGIGFHIKNLDLYNTGEELVDEKFVHIYPQGEEQKTLFTREPQNTDNILVNNENVSVTVTGFDQQFIQGDTICVLIENKTDNYIKVRVDEAFANDIKMEGNPYFGLYNVVINPNAVALYPMTLFDNRMDGGNYGDPDNVFFTTNNITSVEEIQMNLKVVKYIYGESDGETLFQETITLTP